MPVVKSVSVYLHYWSADYVQRNIKYKPHIELFIKHKSLNLKYMTY